MPDAGLWVSLKGGVVLDAFALLNAYAFAESESLRSVAASVVQRELALPVD